MVLLGLACSESGSENSVTSPAPSIRSSSESKVDGDAKTKFHSSNYADWVGKAHNKGLDDLFAALNDGQHGNMCAEIEDMFSKPGHMPADQDKLTTGQRRVSVDAGLAITNLCAGLYATDGSIAVTLASRSAGASTNTLSASANNLLSQIDYASYSSTTAGVLAASLNNVLTQANALPSAERDVIYAVSSVAQYSYEYWAVNLTPLDDQVRAVYGNCLVQYSDQTTAINVCVGIPRPMPTDYDGWREAPLISFASAGLVSAMICNSPDPREVRHTDVQGGVGGALLGWATATAPGILAGAFLGAVAGSGAEALWQVSSHVWCRLRGGSEPLKTSTT